MKSTEYRKSLRGRIVMLSTVVAIALVSSPAAFAAVVTCAHGKVTWVKSNLSGSGKFGFEVLPSDGSAVQRHYFSTDSLATSATARALHRTVLLAAATGEEVTVLSDYGSCAGIDYVDNYYMVPNLYDVSFGRLP